MAPPIVTKQQAATTPRRPPRKPRSLLPASPMNNSQHVSPNGSVVKPPILAKKAPAMQRLTHTQARDERPAHESAVTSSSASSALTAPHTEPLSAFRSAIQQYSLEPWQTFDPSLVTESGGRGDYWSDEEALHNWEMYWDADFNHINRKHSCDMRAQQHNQWRRDNGYTGPDKTWRAMDEHTRRLRAKGVKQEELRVKVHSKGIKPESTAVVRRRVYVESATRNVQARDALVIRDASVSSATDGANGASREQKFMFVDVDNTGRGLTSDTRAHTARVVAGRGSSSDRRSSAKPAALPTSPEQLLRNRLEDQKDIATAATLIQALNNLVSHARDVLKVDPRVMKSALQLGLDDYNDKVKKRHQLSAQQLRTPEVAMAEAKMTAYVKKTAEDMAKIRREAEKKERGVRREAEKVVEPKNVVAPIDLANPPWEQWR
ncbi:hypothetical protein LTR56_014578 [Elasticomyces elasticus]|nr:hypothetical protein LTR56_014578 [Elasticomyces elasticus]KAK3646790.1 hypothetical protein LTR22_014166 [Elasticomyces elasticus]KAK4916367.1 hypothetical protein LTR49_015601 [Elasticomyces elasticus]KAK5755839.1 hypothetical protein LTS12_014070 [Elasticomyces elasticus]